MWRRWLLMQDLASIPLAVSLECRGLAVWQEPHKANFCLDFGLRSKLEPEALSASPQAAVPSCPALRLAHTRGPVEKGVVASVLPNKPPQPFSRWSEIYLLLAVDFPLCFSKGSFFFFLMPLFCDSKCSQNRRESMTCVLFWSLLIEAKCYFCLHS